MLVIKVPSKRKTRHNFFPSLVHQTTGPSTHTPTYNSSAATNKTLFEEAQRRDKIVRALAEKCGLKEGDIAIPARPEKIEEYGDKVRIIKVTDTYGKFGKDEPWPSSDNPMIIHAFSEKTQEHFICTVGFLVKKT